MPPTGAGLNLAVTNGTGTALAFTDASGDAYGTAGFDFFSGLRITDDADGALAGINGAAGTNVLVITYDLTLASLVAPSQILTDTATLTNYTNYDNALPADNHVPEGLRDDAIVTIAAPTVVKSVSDTSENLHPWLRTWCIGEVVEYTVTITVPEGTVGNFLNKDQRQGIHNNVLLWSTIAGKSFHFQLHAAMLMIGYPSPKWPKTLLANCSATKVTFQKSSLNFWPSTTLN